MKRLGVLLAVAMVVSLATGPAGFGMPDTWIFVQLRLPRTLLAAIIGAGLGISGAAMQGVLRNGLADPGLLGISGCAALGSVIVYYWGISAYFAPALPLGGMAGAMLGAFALMHLAGRRPSVASLILGGLMLSSLAAALLSLALTLAPNPFALAEISLWLMGGLEDRSLLHVALAVPPILAGIAVLWRLAPGIDALALGEATAASLGFPAAKSLVLCGVGVALAVGPGCAVAGGIGFVGLMVPHLLRPFFGARPGALLAPSCLLGAGLVVCADVAARGLPLLVPTAAEPRLGVITALLGAPVLIAIARRGNL